MNPTGDFMIGILTLLICSGINLYGKQFINAVTQAIPSTIDRLTATSLKNLVISTVVSTAASTGLYYLF